MDVISLLVSLNKISLVALIVIVGFLSYQIYLLKKEAENKKKKLSVPDFKESNSSSYVGTTAVVTEEKKVYAKSSMLPIIIGVVLFFLFGLIFLIGLLLSKSQDVTKSQVLGPTPIITYVASKGIRIYNQKWKELTDNEVKSQRPGTFINIGIDRVKDPTIDMARIRVNKNEWDKDDITLQYNKQMNVFFKEFLVSTGEAFLKIQAELHSNTDGWLGD